MPFIRRPLPVVPHQPNFARGVVSWISFLVLSFIKIGWKMWEQWGVEILAFPLTWHITYTTACCYHTSRDKRTGRCTSCPLDLCLRPPFSVLASTWFKFLTCIMARYNYLYWQAAVMFFLCWLHCVCLSLYIAYYSGFVQKYRSGVVKTWTVV